MRHLSIVITISLLTVICCEQNRKKKLSEEHKAPIIDKQLSEVQDSSSLTTNSFKKQKNPEPKKINLDSILKDEFNGYLAGLSEDTLSMVSYSTIDITPWINYNEFQRSIEIYTPFENQETVQTVDVYKSDSSYIKMYTYRYENIVEKNIVCGRINNSNLLKHQTIKIGMSKNSFLSIYFSNSEKFNDINCLVVYQDEMGEGWTKYEFDQGALSKISFESVNEWVKR